MTDFEKQISFIMELDKIKKITRQTYLSDGSRKENDADTFLASGADGVCAC